MRRPVTARPSAEVEGPVFSRAFLAGSFETRAVLARLHAALDARQYQPDMIARVEQCIAEVLNNIAEHAYRGRPPGPVKLKVIRRPGALLVEVSDQGAPLPLGLLAETTPCRLDVSLPDLPEGGFGWHLIHRQADRIRHFRNGRENRLQLVFFDESRP